MNNTNLIQNRLDPIAKEREKIKMSMSLINLFKLCLLIYNKKRSNMFYGVLTSINYLMI